MDSAEDHLWWYAGLHAYLLAAFERARVPIDAPILDAGCGTGGLLRDLASVAARHRRYGLERFEAAAIRAQQKSGATVVGGSVNDLPFADAAFGAIFSADVLYHRTVSPEQAAREALRCLLPGGVFLVNVPAFQWLSSYHDQRVHGALRFDRKQLMRLLTDAGFTRVSLHYWNSLLFPVMAARRLRPARTDAPSDVERLPKPVNMVLNAIVAFERQLIQFGVRFPFGGSILAVAFKP